MAKNHHDIWDIVDGKSAAYFELSDTVWDHPETNYEEYVSSAAHAAMLEAEGFRVSRGIAGLPTAVMGEAGDEGPVIAILGEFDALPGLSQIAGIAEEQPIEAGGHGHGCGHNLLGAGSLLAAAAVKQYLKTHGIKGRVRYYGCPAEEGGSAKGFMVREGLFGIRHLSRASMTPCRWPATKLAFISPVARLMPLPLPIWGAVLSTPLS
jgi:aminobenzoyl-glutamate utilization protein B